MKIDINSIFYVLQYVDYIYKKLHLIYIYWKFLLNAYKILKMIILK